VEVLSLAFDTSASPDDFDRKLASFIQKPTATKPPAEPAEETAADATAETAEKPHGKKPHKSGKK
jgi:molecular chaperone DnaK (HSP70)